MMAKHIVSSDSKQSKSDQKRAETADRWYVKNGVLSMVGQNIWLQKVMEDHELNMTAKAVAAQIMLMRNLRTGAIFFRQRTLAEKLGILPRTVNTAVRDLRNRGWLLTEEKEIGGILLYRLALATIPAEDVLGNPTEEGDVGGEQNSSEGMEEFYAGGKKDSSEGIGRKLRTIHMASVPTASSYKETDGLQLKGAAEAPPSSVAFEAGIIRLTQKDLDAWKRAYSDINVEAELHSMSAWAGKQESWFDACRGLLGKKNSAAHRDRLAIQARAEADAKVASKPRLSLV